MKSYTFFLFLVGIVIGVSLNFIFLVESNIDAEIDQNELFKEFIDPDQSELNQITVDDVKKIRILCFIDTAPKFHSTRAIHILQTWGKHCDKILFASTLTDVNLGAIGFNVSDDHDHLWGKTKLKMQYIHKNFINDYDWFFKGDDDTFLIPENLRFLLSSYSSDDPIYFGYKMKTGEHKRGYFSGGSGYVMSKKTVRIFVEDLMTNQEFFHGNEGSGCHLETDKRTEDWDISVCLDKYNVYAGDGRDMVNRDRFLMFWPEMHLFAESQAPDWYWNRFYYPHIEGIDCCSNYTVSMHYIDPKQQYSQYYLIYRLQTFGVVSKFPSPPKKYNFSDVADRLDRERFNETLRGF